jgi:hypothetical protein
MALSIEGSMYRSFEVRVALGFYGVLLTAAGVY